MVHHGEFIFLNFRYQSSILNSTSTKTAVHPGRTQWGIPYSFKSINFGERAKRQILFSLDPTILKRTFFLEILIRLWSIPGSSKIIKDYIISSICAILSIPRSAEIPHTFPHLNILAYLIQHELKNSTAQNKTSAVWLHYFYLENS